MPGCESFETVGENRFTARLTAKVGPVKARFNFKVSLTEVDPPNGYTINGEGQGGAAGFANGNARVSLAEEAGVTVLSYSVQARVGGKLAQLGGRLIDGAAKKLADQFFSNFIALISEEGGETKQSESVDGTRGQKSGAGGSATLWPSGKSRIILLAALLALLLGGISLMNLLS